MLINHKNNNYRNPKLIEMDIRNQFKINGYYIYYMVREEKGQDLILQEYYDNTVNKGFFLISLIPEFQFETTNVFQKFGITIPNQISFWVQIDKVNENLAGTGLNIEEGDLIGLFLQNRLFKNKTITQLNQEDIKQLIASGANSMNYLFEVTNIDSKAFVFNGTSYFYKILCKVFEKKVSVNFSGDLDFMNGKIGNNPTPNPIVSPINPPDPTQPANPNTEPEYTKFDNGISDLLKFDDTINP